MLIPLAAIVVLGISNYNLIKDKIKGFSSESDVKEQKIDDRKMQNEFAEEKIENEMLSDTGQAEDTIVASTAKEDTVKAVKKEVTDREISAEEEKAAEPEKKYYIVAGSFSIEKNAEKLMKKLQSKGYNSEIFGRTRHGLTMVSYEAFVTKSEALKELNRIIRQENPNAWLIKY